MIGPRALYFLASGLLAVGVGTAFVDVGGPNGAPVSTRTSAAPAPSRSRIAASDVWSTGSVETGPVRGTPEPLTEVATLETKAEAPVAPQPAPAKDALSEKKGANAEREAKPPARASVHRVVRRVAVRSRRAAEPQPVEPWGRTVENTGLWATPYRAPFYQAPARMLVPGPDGYVHY